MKWLFVTANPWPLHHGTALRVFYLARELVLGGEEITVMSDWQGDSAQDAYHSIGVDYEEVRHSSNCMEKQGLYFVNSNYVADLKRCATDYDVVVLFSAEMMCLSKFCSDFPLVVADVIDDPILAAWRRLKRPSSLRWALRNIRLLWDLRRYEKRYRSYVDLFTFVTNDDAQNFQRRNTTEDIVAIPNGVSFVDWPLPAEDSVSPYMVFVGNYKFVPNRTAAEFLVQEIAPLVWLRNPDVRFCLVGSNPLNG